MARRKLARSMRWWVPGFACCGQPRMSQTMLAERSATFPVQNYERGANRVGPAGCAIVPLGFRSQLSNLMGRTEGFNAGSLGGEPGPCGSQGWRKTRPRVGFASRSWLKESPVELPDEATVALSYCRSWWRRKLPSRVSLPQETSGKLCRPAPVKGSQPVARTQPYGGSRRMNSPISHGASLRYARHASAVRCRIGNVLADLLTLSRRSCASSALADEWISPWSSAAPASAENVPQARSQQETGAQQERAGVAIPAGNQDADGVIGSIPGCKTLRAAH